MGTLSIQAGLIALQNKNYKAVHADSIRAVQQDPYDPVPYFLLGVIAADHGNPAIQTRNKPQSETDQFLL